MFCSHCGQQNPEQGRFCQSCGQPRASTTLSGAATVLGAGAGPGATLSETPTQLRAEEPAGTASRASLIGQIVGNYELLRELGAGGMARVFLARQRGLERKVALKLFHASLIDDPHQVARFRREARLLAQLDHPHIVPVIEVVESGPWLGLAMGFAGGGSVRGLVRREGLPVASVANIGAQAARGLAYAASRGIVHRDIKPDNLLLAEDGRVLLADFGIARAQSSEKLTATHALLGTPAYMAPEQWEDSKTCDHRSDLYALGCVLYELAAGHPPFEGARLAEVMRQHLLDVPAPLPGELGSVISRLVAKRPDDRFPDGEAVARALEVVAAGALTTAAPRSEPQQPEPPPAEPSPSPPARQPAAVAPESAPEQVQPQGSGRGCGCLLLVALAVGGYLWEQEWTQAPPAPAAPEVAGRLSLWPGSTATEAAALAGDWALLAGEEARLVGLPDQLLARPGAGQSRCAALAPDGLQLALGYGRVGQAEKSFSWEWQEGGTRLFDLFGQQILELPAQGGVSLLGFVPGAPWLAQVSAVGDPSDGRNLTSRLELWNLRSGRLEGAADDGTGVGGALAFSADGGLLALGSRGGAWTKTDQGVLAISNARLALYSLPMLQELTARPSLEVRALAFSPEGGRLAVGSRDPVGRTQLNFHFPAVQLLRLPDLELQTLLPLRGEMARALAWLPAGARDATSPELLAVGCKDGSALVFETSAARECAYLQAAEAGEVLAIAFSADGHRLLAACEAGLVEWVLPELVGQQP